MKYRLIVALAAFPAGLYSRTAQLEKANTVGKMCGQVTLVESNGTSYSYHYRREPVKKADVLLFRRIAKTKCCAPDELIAQTPTDSGGGFEFKDAVPAQYWVVVVVGKKKYKLAVALIASEKKGEEDCSLLDYEVINGRALRLERMYRLQ